MRTPVVPAVSLALILIVMSGSVASAQSQATAEGSNQVSTTFWSVTPAGRAGSPQTGTFLITWPVTAQSLAYHYFDGVNTGSEDLTGATFTGVSVDAVANPNQNAVVTFEWCQNGSWNLTNNTCGGTLVVLGSNSGPGSVTTAINQNLAPGDRLQLRASTPRNRTGDLTTTISFSVGRTSVRSGFVSNS